MVGYTARSASQLLFFRLIALLYVVTAGTKPTKLIKGYVTETVELKNATATTHQTMNFEPPTKLI